MRPATIQYPVDRYLVESSKKIEMVNIIDDEIWNPEPALRPEDEIILRKLHDMLQSTADDLKVLSGELTRFHEPGVQVKTQVMPLDEAFNEKVHIEEVVNAKFHGYKIVDKSPHFSPECKPENVITKSLVSKSQKNKAVNVSVQVNPASSLKKPTSKNLQMSRTKVVQIKEDNRSNLTENHLNKAKVKKSAAKVHYNEFSYEYHEPQVESASKKLQVQKMPDVNIRGELKKQNVLKLDIMPENYETAKSTRNTNVGVINVQHDPPRTSFAHKISEQPKSPQVTRKISRMSTCESSESTNNISSDAQQRLNLQKQLKVILGTSPKTSARADKSKQKPQITKKDPLKRTSSSLEEWKRKLSSVYGQPSNSRKAVPTKCKKNSPKKCNISSRPKSNLLNNAEYIPYSKLTLGGVKVSDIEKEISNIPNKTDIPLSPILDKILSSRENSFHKDSPRKTKKKYSPKILTTSDENLLQEVIEIEKTVQNTLAKSEKAASKKALEQNDIISDIGEESSYADDFEEDKSEKSVSLKNNNNYKSPSGSRKSDGSEVHSPDTESDFDNNKNGCYPTTSKPNIEDQTYTKIINLSLKNSVDVFEFVHSIDTHETGTQSNSTSKISLKETQTSPRNEKSIIQPIHNDLWPTIDPKGEVENLFHLEKEFIKKLILDEYGEILEKNITKPSTSNEPHCNNNVKASQKNTQTSPAHVKSVMTSPTHTKTRTTSPFSVSLKVDRQTSPLVDIIHQEELNIAIEEQCDDLGISINLSSPRFSLRLPQNSREVLSNLGVHSPLKIDQEESNPGSKTFRKYTVSSSSSVDADSSSDISSLGEVKMKLKRRLKVKKNVISSLSESSSSVLSRYSSDLASGDILPLKSEGELSLGQVEKKPNRRKQIDL